MPTALAPLALCRPNLSLDEIVWVYLKRPKFGEFALSELGYLQHHTMAFLTETSIGLAR